jgi:hypothetical protein
MGKVFCFLLFLLFTFSSKSQCTTISDGTYGNSQTSPLAPLYGLYDYGWSSTIYYPSDIGSSRNIGTISWYVDGFQSGYSQTGPYTFSNIKIYFSYTTLSGWANTSNVSGVNRLTGINSAQGITSWTKVYDGSMTFNASDVWKTITLDTPFSYNGTSNLVVHVENWDGSYSSGYPIFHYTNTTSSGNRTMKYGSQDGSMGPTSGTRFYSRPDIKFCSVSVLPIELLYFKPYYENNVVKLKWVTSSEIDNDYFTIEKTLDGVNIENIETIDGLGNSKTLKEYYTEDRTITSKVMYYRLKQTDFNGKTTKTDWYSVDVELTNDIVIYPNPVNDELKIKFNNGISNTDIKIYDLTGKIIYETNYNDINGVGEIDIDLTNVPKGLYLVEILNNLYKLEHN